MRVGHLLLLVSVGLAGCGHDFEPPDTGERMREAEAVYSAELFDTLNWESDSVRSFEGNAVYAAQCRRCHGTMGRGETEYAQERHLDVLSLVEPEWPFGSSLDSLRHAIFAGHEGGMPIFGVAGITPREIDASAFFVLYTLRPDAQQTGSP